MTLQSLRSGVAPFHVMEVVAAAADQERRTGERVLHLEVGQPSAGAPPRAVERAHELLRGGDALGYTPALGIAALRERIAAHYEHRYGLEIDPARIAVTNGATGAFVATLLARFDPGQRVAYAVPGYPCYPQLIGALGLIGAPQRIGPADGFLLRSWQLDALHHQAPLDGVVLAAPANPTGTQYRRDELDDVLGWCRANGVQAIVDELYHGITYDEAAPSAASDPDAIVIGSFSKYFCMTGWRLGWLIAPPALVAAIDRLSQHFWLSPPTLAQHIAVAAFDDTEVLDAHVERYRTNRTVLSDALTALGVSDIAPCDGAFYLYGNVAHWGIDSFELAQRWLSELNVAVAPGIDFDPELGHDWIRWSFAGATSDVVEAAQRLSAWAQNHG